VAGRGWAEAEAAVLALLLQVQAPVLLQVEAEEAVLLMDTTLSSSGLLERR